MLGCDGGETPEAIDVMVERFGGRLAQLKDYPYAGQDTYCNKDAWSYDEHLLKGFYQVKNNDTLLKYALLSGPISISIAVPDAMFAYAGGVYDDKSCKETTEDDLIHAVTLVGYDTTDPANPYWIVRNSWSALWGVDGHIFIKFGYCGVTLDPTVAVFEKPE